MFISTVEYNLYQLDEATGQTIRLGKVPVWFDFDEGICRVYNLSQRPAFDGSVCQIELQNMVTAGKHNLLYNIPIMIDGELMNMRCAYWFDKAEYEVLGLREGYARMLGIHNMREQCFLTAAVHNIKRLVKAFFFFRLLLLYMKNPCFLPKTGVC